jgi:small subunit ribosomal protein S7
VVKVFGRWGTEGIEVRDKGLERYINLEPRIVPDTGGRWSKKRFGRRKYNIVERLVNKLMITGHIKGTKKHVFTSGRNTGKKQMAMKFVEEAFGEIETKKKENPIQVLVRAIEHSAPRAEVTTVEYGGIRTPVAVDTAPVRRVDMALGFLAKGAAQKSNRSRTPVNKALADQIIAAADNDPKCFAVDRKTMMEKQSEASR